MFSTSSYDFIQFKIAVFPLIDGTSSMRPCFIDPFVQLSLVLLSGIINRMEA